MKYCNLNCPHLHSSIIERCGEGIGYEYRCMAQKAMPKVTIDTYCPYEELSETTLEANTEINELKQELEVYKKALELMAIQYSYFFHSGKDCPFNDEELSWCKELTNRIDCSKECVQRYFLSKARVKNDT